MPSTQLRSGDGGGGLDGLAQGQAAGFDGEGQVQCGGQQPPFAVGPVRGDVRGPLQVGGGQPEAAAGRFGGGELLQFGGQVLVGLVQGGHPVFPCHGLADQVGGPGVQQPAPADRDAGVDRVPDQWVADRHRAAWFGGPQVDQAGGRGRLDRRAGRGHLRGLAQLGQRRALVQHRQHLQDDPALGRHGPHIISDGRAQRPGPPVVGRGFGRDQRADGRVGPPAAAGPVVSCRSGNHGLPCLLVASLVAGLVAGPAIRPPRPERG